MGASPVEDEADRRRRKANEEAARQRQDDDVMFTWDVEVVASSPFGRSDEGRKVVKVLRALLSSGNVVYGGTLETSRADWDGETIRLNDNYRAKALPSIVELVHEGSHIVWRQAHPRPRDPAAAKKDDEADEALARKNQIAVYKYLLEAKGLPADAGLEARLRKQGGHSGG
jgi:hypothetical protein